MERWHAGGRGQVSNNTGTWQLTGGTKYLSGTVVNNSGKITQDSGQLQFNSAILNNTVAGIYDIASDGDVFYNTGNPSAFNNAGVLAKTAGGGASNLPGLPFNNVTGGIAESDTGTLNLSGGGTSTGGTYIAALGAVVNLTGSSTTTWSGTFTGSGSGAVVLSDGTLQSGVGPAIFNFPTGLFHWQGGTLSGNITNSNDLVISGTSYLTNATLTNNATIEQTGGQLQFPDRDSQQFRHGHLQHPGGRRRPLQCSEHECLQQCRLV